MNAMTELLCPKCQAPMRVIERSGVTLERCGECGGIFLDRGELERLQQAETAYMEQHARDWRDDDDDDRARHIGRPEHKTKKKKRRGFLEDLFEFGD